MNSIIKKISSLGVLIAMLVVAPLASANYSINSLPNDCKTVTVGNYTTGEGINGTCWTNSSVSASVGQVINVAIYYNNSGTTAANNVVFKLSNSGTTVSQNGTVSFTGKIFVDGVEVKSETVTANISGGPAQLVLGNVMRYDKPSHANVPISNGNSILSSSGLSYGTLNPGWDNQGVIKVSYTVIGPSCNNCGNQGQKPTVQTDPATNLSDTTGKATLNGYFNSNGSSTETWFKYRRNNGSWNETTHQSNGISNGFISRNLTDLATGDYEFQAFAQNTYGISSGDIEDFSIDRNDDNNCDDCCDNDCGNDSDLQISTQSAEDIDEDSAVLVGDIEDVGEGNVERWFEWDTNKNDVEDGDGSTLSLSGDTDNEGEFTKQLSGLQSDRTYYFRACGEDDDGNQDCGSVKSFRTDDDNNNNNNNDDDNDLPDITTLGTIAIGSTVATVDGYYDANGCSVTTYFEYGRTSSLGSTTPSYNRGNSSGSMAYSFTSLAANTTYYYRAVGTNCEGTTRGSTRSFTTGSTTIVNPPVVITTGGGSGNSFIRLMIDNHRDIVRSGREVVYDVSWENVTSRDLKDLVLEVNFPEQVTIVETDQGSIERRNNAVVVEIENLDGRESGTMSITTEVTGNLRDGDPVVAQAIMAFENPTTQATENAIAYDSDEFSSDNSVLGASLFGLGFLPTSLAGWLILLLILLLIIIAARYFMRQNGGNQVTVATGPINPNPAPASNPADYIVYRPTPKQ